MDNTNEVGILFDELAQKDGRIESSLLLQCLQPNIDIHQMENSFQLSTESVETFEVTDLLGALQTPNEVKCDSLETDVLSPNIDNLVVQDTKEPNYDTLETDVLSPNLDNVVVQDSKEPNYQVSELLGVLQTEKNNNSKNAKQGRIQIVDKKVINVQKQEKKKTWGDISAEKRPHDRRKYHIVGDTSHLHAEDAFPLLGQRSQQQQQIPEKQQKVQKMNLGVWGAPKTAEKIGENQDFEPKEENINRFVRNFASKFKNVPESLIRCILENVNYDVGIAEHMLHDMELDSDTVQGNSESEVENNVPLEYQESSQDAYHKYRSKALQLSKEAKKLRRRAWQAYRNGSQLEGEHLLKEAGKKLVSAKDEHAEAAKKIFSQVNQGYQDNPWRMDLHGLFPDEALAVLTERLKFLHEFSVYDKNKQPLEIITGRGRHSSDGESILFIAVDNYLRGQAYQHNVRAGSVFVWMGRKRSIINT
eukprot:TRINITY_DN5811_c0_g1_i4.p1 TRINITY_DN5811_c0_g1~~TRINITY_DN5811_c0_g1_i4.p1  ORF type:complete len:475 (+),score=78.78 TRINITY_DN5811_c0_g1_i4:92-1516(+)